MRTLLQAEWADLYERLADAWGRQIRYGLEPNPDVEGRVTGRKQLVGELQELSLDYIAQYEKALIGRSPAGPPRGMHRALRGQTTHAIAQAMKARQLNDQYERILAEWRESLLQALEALAHEAELTT